MADFDQRANMLTNLIRADKKEDALQELSNLQLCYRFIIQKTNPKMLTYACLVKSVNGKTYPNKLTDDDLAEIKADVMRTGITFAKIKQALRTIKKKYAKELETLLPSMGSSPETLVSYRLLKKKILLQCRYIQGEDVAKEIEEVDRRLIHRYKTLKFSGQDGVEAQHKLGYIDTAAAISEHTGQDVRNMSALQYLRTIVRLKERAEKSKRA